MVESSAYAKIIRVWRSKKTPHIRGVFFILSQLSSPSAMQLINEVLCRLSDHVCV